MGAMMWGLVLAPLSLVMGIVIIFQLVVVLKRQKKLMAQLDKIAGK